MRLAAIDQQRELDVICLGRAGVDLYAQQAHKAFNEVTGFNKFVGGSPANIATAVSKLGGKAGFIGCVSADGLGDYVRTYLTDQSINLEGMQTDSSGTRTSLALTQMQPNSPEVVLYRNNAADLALAPEHIQSSYIQRAKMLLISGTALCQSPSREATLLAMKLAKAERTLIVLDMDYRDYSWSNIQTASLYYQIAVELADIVIGNTEEFAVLNALHNNNTKTAVSDDKSAQHLLEAGCELVIIKAGEDGSKVFTKEPHLTNHSVQATNTGTTATLKINMFKGAVFQVQAQKPFGAGDAFAGALLFALINHYTLVDAVAMGAACAAINVAGTSCTEASPTLAQLLSFMQQRNYQFDNKKPQ
jgi:5-dehydro-2-deoxygluconokinase